MDKFNIFVEEKKRNQNSGTEKNRALTTPGGDGEEEKTKDGVGVHWNHSTMGWRRYTSEQTNKCMPYLKLAKMILSTMILLLLRNEFVQGRFIQPIFMR